MRFINLVNLRYTLLVEPMAWPRLQILVTAASLLLQLVVAAQRDVVIKVSFDKTSSYFYEIGFNISLFTEFHECLIKSTVNCMADYGEKHCPNCIVENVTQSGQGNQELRNYYYNCTNDSSKTALNCEATSPGTQTDSYLLRNSSHSSTCFGFVWASGSENITFNSNHWDVEYCGANCACPSRSTTPQSGTATTILSSSPAESVSSTPVTSAPPSPLTSSEATQGTSPTKTSTGPTTVVSTTSISFPSTDSSSGTDNSGDDPPIAVIVGAVVGVIAVIVIIIIIVVIWRKRRDREKSSDHGAGVKGKGNDGKSHSYPNTEFSESASKSHTPNYGVIKTNGNLNAIHQPSITKDGVTPFIGLPKSQFAIKDNDSDFGYSKAQPVVGLPEDNNNTNGKKSRDDYDYVYAEGNPKPETTRDKTSAVSPPKMKEDYAVVDKTRKNKTSDKINANTSLTNDYNIIPEEDYGYSHAEGDPCPQDTNDAAVSRAHVTVPTGALPGTSDQDFSYEYAQASDGYSTVGDRNYVNPNNGGSNAKNIYSRLHEPVRDIQNPYNVGPNTNDVYSKLHEEVRDIQNPYNVLPEPQVASDSNNALPDTVNVEHDTEEQIKTT